MGFLEPWEPTHVFAYRFMAFRHNRGKFLFPGRRQDRYSKSGTVPGVARRFVCSLPSAVVPSPIPSVPFSRYKQRWQSSLHNTWHPIALRQSFVLWCSFVLQWSSFKLRHALLVLWQALLARALMVFTSASMVLALRRSSLAIWRVSLTIQLASLQLPQPSLGISSCTQLLHETRCGQYFVVGVSTSYLYKPEINNTNRVCYYSVTGEKYGGISPS